ncbi:kinesin-like protein KIF2C isoform X2 [Hemibagrus wyckioides]|uniref:kinesin-like protein KIF2C isoform X2 n=1 Tax=Hemibagrus wyckioides TaxID=337641 RepID=UPI00266D8C2E|nr:kinesin-like protein KIF2C isoform X2 [Hemibagrus wyckioides]
MDPATATLLVGLAVKISRSDGRVHSATVKTVNATKSTVHVEWNEKEVTKGKEIDFGDIYHLNAELLEYLQTSKQAGPSTAPAPLPARAPKGERKSEYPTKSKLPAPSELASPAGPSEEPVPRRMTTRQTCLFRPPTIPSAGLNPTDDAPSQEQPSSTIPRPSGLPSYSRRQVAKPPSPLLPAIEAVSESEASKCAPAPAANQRLSRAPEVNKTTNKRLSVLIKNPDTQTKKGKYGDMNRPNKQFYQMIEEYRETVEKVPLSLSDPVELHRICVCVRKRPLNKKEIAKKEIDVVTIPGNGVLLFHEPKQKVDLTKYLDNQPFHFDYSFDEDASNDLVYRFTAKPLVKTVFEGGRATCFAYGQTGSGKTHTMGGDFSGKAQNSSKGIYALAAQDVFTLLQQKRHSDLCPYVTFFEIYNGKVFDLLNKKAKLRVLEDENQQVQVVGLQEMPVSSVEDVIKMIEKGSACRTSGQTFANANSSRSHAVLQVILRRHKLLHGKFSLVDLAGNERGTDVSSNDRQTMVETAEINRSLLALKECIRSLGQNSEHIPFRMSKLTQVLRDSFIGENSRTCMIAMISPGMNSCEYTLNTLRYADRVKELNGLSKGTAPNTKLTEESEEGSSSLEEEGIPAELEVMAQMSELEERFYEDLQGGSDIARAMEHTSFDVISGLPEIDAYMERLQGSYHALRSAIEALKARSPNLAWHANGV